MAALASLSVLTDSASAQIERIIRPTNMLGAGALGIAELPDGYVTVGTGFPIGGDRTIVLTRHTLGGSVLWQRSLAGAGNDLGFCIIATSDHGFLIAGETDSLSASRGYSTIIKTDGNGNVLWAKAIPAIGFDASPISCGLRETSAGTYILAGRTREGLDISTSFATATQFAPDGSLIWSYRYTDPRSNITSTGFTDIREVTDNAGQRRFLAVGYNLPRPVPEPTAHAIAALINPADGVVTLARDYTFFSATESSHANGLLQLDAQSVRLTGQVGGSGFNATIVWDIGTNLAPTSPGAFFPFFFVAHNAIQHSPTAPGVTTLAGMAINLDTTDGMLMTLGTTPGQLVWSKKYGGARDDTFNALLTRPDGILAVGYSNSFNENFFTPLYTARTDPLGRDGCESPASLPPSDNSQVASASFELNRIAITPVPYSITSVPTQWLERVVCNPCPADFNEDGFLDFFDYDGYVNCFESGACPPGQTADFNGDGFVDFFDYDAYVAAFEAGC